MIRTASTSEADYTVHLKADAIESITLAPADAVYLDELVAAIEPAFRIHFNADRPMTGSVNTYLKAIVQAHEPGANQPIVLRAEETLAEPSSRDITGLGAFTSEETLRVPLDTYRDQALQIDSRLEQALDYELLLEYRAVLTLDLLGGTETISKATSLLIPLNEPVFRIARQQDPGPADLEPVTQTVRYQVHLDALPYLVFLIAAGLSLLSLILLATTTRNQPKERFWRQLRRMKRQLKGRLILIGDRAWDPSWCVSIADFDSLADTARKLKQPVYGYVDQFSAWPVAYFYTLTSENTYCYIFTEHPELLEQEASEAEPEPAMPLPVLPETEELPDAETSPEIRPTRPYGSDQADQ